MDQPGRARDREDGGAGRPDAGGGATRRAGHGEVPSNGEVDDASEASFPASDPPAWSATPPGGPRRARRRLPRDGAPPDIP
jgi:hypothetical protein